MPALLISDLHLDAARPGAVAALEALLAREAARIDALYVLGDLFETWVGDDDPQGAAARAADAFARLADRGVHVALQHGNRDFLLGADFAARAGARLLSEESVVAIDGENTLLMHGDSLCLGDATYLAFRRQVRDPTWQERFLAQPLAERLAFAARARAASAQHTAVADEAIMDVDDGAVRDALRRHGVRRLIHGHTHRPATHAFDLDGKLGERRVLGDWYVRGHALRVADGRYTVSTLSLGD